MEKLTQKDWDKIWKLVALSESADTNEAKAATDGIFRMLKSRGVTLRAMLSSLQSKPSVAAPKPPKEAKFDRYAAMGMSPEEFRDMIKNWNSKW